MVFAIQIRMDWKTQTVIGFGLRETSGPAQDGVKTTSAVFCHVTLVDGEATEVPVSSPDLFIYNYTYLLSLVFFLAKMAFVLGLFQLEALGPAVTGSK